MTNRITTWWESSSPKKRGTTVFVIFLGLLTGIVIYGVSQEAAKPEVPTTLSKVPATTPVVKGEDEITATKSWNDFLVVYQKDLSERKRVTADLIAEVQNLQKAQFGVSDIAKVSETKTASPTAKTVPADTAKAVNLFEEKIKQFMVIYQKDRDEEVANLKIVKAALDELKTRRTVCCSSHELMESPKNLRKVNSRAKSTTLVPKSKGGIGGPLVREESSVVTASTAGAGEHKWTDINTDRARCNLRNNGVIMETVFRANEGECIDWETTRAIELGLLAYAGGTTKKTSMASTSVVSDSKPAQTETDVGPQPCRFILNDKVVATTPDSRTMAECRVWQAREAKDRGLIPK